MLAFRSRRLSAYSAIVLAAVIAACGPSADGPVAPSFKPLGGGVVPLLTTNTLWDFAAIIPGALDPEDLGTTETIAQAGSGSIAATTGAAGQHITVKGRSLPVGDTERGLGLCLTATSGDPTTCQFPADGDEVGDSGPGALLLNFSNVLPVGSTLAQIELGSVQVNEGYKISISTDNGVTFGAPTTSYGGDANDNATVVIDLPTAGLVIKLEKAADVVDNDNDYTVKNVTTSFTTDENLEGRMTGGGVKATGDNGEIVTFGLTLHCDILLSNNLEVNWQGHQWHIAKPIVSSKCSNEPNIAPPPPVSPIDTFEGTAFGRLDGVGNSLIKFRFQDAGEPGNDDTVEITIYQPGSLVNVALHITAQKISVGNWQMHYDQPHGQKP
jgi:hypothetical protein